MNYILNKIIYLATGLASIGFALLCVLTAIFAAATGITIMFLLAAVGFLIYGVTAYYWAAVSIISNTVKEKPVLLMYSGLAIVLVTMTWLMLL